MPGEILERVVLVGDVVRDRRFQPRTFKGGLLYDADEVARMAEAGKANGYPSGWDPTLYDAIRVWEEEGALLVFEGYHRLALAELCGHGEIQARVHVGFTEDEIRGLAARSNLKTKAMDPMDEALVYRQAYDSGSTAEQVAQQYERRPPGYYDRRVLLSYLSPGLQADVRNRMLPVDYAEVVGQAAKDGASGSMQAHLAGIALRTKVRVDLYRRLVRVIMAKAKGLLPDTKDQGLLLLDVPPDMGIEAATQVVEQATVLAGIRDGWVELRQVGQRQLRRFERIRQPAPEELSRLLAHVEVLRASADRSLGEVLGETVEVQEDGTGEAVREARPLLKWVGSKATEAPLLVPLIRQRLAPGGRYLEPFLGSGAVYFAMAPEKALLGDVLAPLIALYEEVRSSPGLVARMLSRALDEGMGREQYEAMRRMYNEARRKEGLHGPMQAALLLYLNRTGFNGLYRTNGKGEYNVPWGQRKSPQFPTLADLERAAMMLRKAELRACSWREIVREAGPGDCVFADPPYPGTFVDYAKEEGAVDTAELANELRGAWERGAGVVITFPGGMEWDPYWSSWCQRVPLARRTQVAAKGGARGTLDQVAWISKEVRP